MSLGNIKKSTLIGRLQAYKVGLICLQSFYLVDNTAEILKP